MSSSNTKDSDRCTSNRDRGVHGKGEAAPRSSATHRSRRRTGCTTPRRFTVDYRCWSEHRAHLAGTVSQVPCSQSKPDRRTRRVRSNPVSVWDLSAWEDADQQARKPGAEKAVVPGDAVCCSLQPERSSNLPKTERARQAGQSCSNRCCEEVATNCPCHLQKRRDVPSPQREGGLTFNTASDPF
jgi:hypothetical protein